MNDAIDNRFYREKAIGGSDVCHTCEAHVVAILDLEKERDALAAELAKMVKARELSAEASATLRDESIAKNERISALEAAAEKVHGIIAEYWGPCMGSVESLLTLREAVGERARTWGPKVSDLPRVTELETPVESREPKTPYDWEYWPEKPMHSMSVHHRGRIVDGIWRCWDCPATHDVEYTSDLGEKR